MYRKESNLSFLKRYREMSALTAKLNSLINTNANSNSEWPSQENLIPPTPNQTVKVISTTSLITESMQSCNNWITLNCKVRIYWNFGAAKQLYVAQNLKLVSFGVLEGELDQKMVWHAYSKSSKSTDCKLKEHWDLTDHDMVNETNRTATCKCKNFRSNSVLQKTDLASTLPLNLQK